MQSDHDRVVHYLDELERHIESTLLDSWILRVEHTEEVSSDYTRWQQWGESLYCVKEARPVIHSIQECRLQHPSHSVRLNAEKTSPRTRFIYSVYRSDGSTGTARILPEKCHSQSGRSGAWLEPLRTGAIAARTRIWRIVTIAGMLLGSFLLFEELTA